MLSRFGCLHLCKDVEMQLPLMRLPSMLLDNTKIQDMEMIETFDPYIHDWYHSQSDKVHYELGFTYGHVRSGLSDHIERRSALQHLFAECARESMGRFWGHVLDAYSVANTNTRFHILQQLFEDRIFAVYGYITHSIISDARTWDRLRYLMPVYTPCQCAWKAYVTGLPCRCGASYLPL